MKIGDEVFVHGYVDEIRKDVIIIRNDGGYFGTVPSEMFYYEEDDRGYGTMNSDDTPQTEEQRKVQEAEHRMANIIANKNPQTDCGWK